LEIEGRYAAMLSHEPKNYALLRYDGSLVLRGVAFHSSRAEPFGERFLREASRLLLSGDIPGVRDVYARTIALLRTRALPTADVAALVRLTKTPQEYLATRAQRRELPYEALLANGREHWSPGDRARVYRATAGRAGLLPDAHAEKPDPRDYDATYYTRVLRDIYASRMARALSRETFEAVFADPDRPTLFSVTLANAEPVLTVMTRVEEI
jgi:DNA polymerase elongation subunit (family B)